MRMSVWLPWSGEARAKANRLRASITDAGEANSEQNPGHKSPFAISTAEAIPRPDTSANGNAITLLLW